MYDDPLPNLSPYRARQALETYQEAQQIMNPVEVQVTEAIVGYLQSGEFISLFVIFFAYRLGRHLATFAPSWRRK